MLRLHEVKASIDEQTVLQGVTLTVKPGEIHVIMGLNGSGKSTLGKVLAGDPTYTVTGGEASFDGQDLWAMSPQERAQAGVFLGFQHPVSLPGVSNMAFLKAMYTAQCEARQETPMATSALMAHIRDLATQVGLRKEHLTRGVNEGFSGGEKKRNEILQMQLLNPRLAILDELDSGLDVDALQSLAGVVAKTHHASRALILITHYERLLQSIQPDFVHIMHQGKLLASGDESLVKRVEQEGYAWLTETS